MKVLLVSIFMPSKENKGGPTQPVFDLAKHANKGIELDLLAYKGNIDEVPDESKEVFNEIYIESPIKMNSFSYLLSTRLPRKIYKPPSFINFLKYDLIWLYQEWLYLDFNKIHPKILVTGMDCSVLLYSRSLLRNPAYRAVSMISKIARSWSLEQSIKPQHIFHAMGQPDIDAFKFVNKRVKCFYGRHPLPRFQKSVKRSSTNNQNSPLRVALTGGYSKFYMGKFPKRMVNSFKKKAKLQNVEWVFLGKNWHSTIKGMQSLGYNTVEELWVEDYDSFFNSIDVHIVPLQVGTGTKGKVLHSVASGVITIGSECAYENIIEGESLLKFKKPEDIYEKVESILTNRDEFQLSTDNLSKRTIESFDPIKVGSQFWMAATNYANKDAN